MSGTGVLSYGSTSAIEVSKRYLGAYATVADMLAAGADARSDGGLVLADGLPFIYVASSESAEGLTPTTDALGRYLPVYTHGAILTARFAALANLAAARVGSVLTASANGAIGTVNGVSTVAVGDVVLVAAQTTGADNGLYVVTSLGAAGAPFVLTRSVYWDTTAKATAHPVIKILSGTTGAASLYLLTNATAITLNTTALTFASVNV
jgi:hypothetical protein